MVENVQQRFRLPRYQEIPNVGLYLEQATRYIGECFAPLLEGAITASMISNYVKRGLVSNPIKKQYSREQIADLIYITVFKTVLSMEDIRLILRLQREVWDTQAAYEYFCAALEDMLSCIAEGKSIPEAPEEEGAEKILFYNTIVAVAHTICLRKQFSALQKEGAEQKAD